MKPFRTLLRVPPDHPSYALGYKRCHVVVFAPDDDHGGLSDVVAIEIPEALDGLTDAMAHATERRTRVLFVCDSASQARQVARRAAELLPDHRRVALERVRAGQFGRLQ